MPEDEDDGWTLVLSVEFAGEVFRWSSGPLDDASLDGVDVVVDESLATGITITDALGLSSGANARSMTFEVYWPIDFDVAAHELAGHRLAGASAEVALVPEGGSLDDRLVVHRGFVSHPQFGDTGEPVTFTVRGVDEDLDREIPTATERVTAQTWPDAPSSSAGVAYPYVWGSPGVYTDEDGTTRRAPATPAVIVEAVIEDDVGRANTLLLSAGWVAAAQVVLWWRVPDANKWARTTVDVVLDTDGLGQRVSTVDTSGNVNTLREAGEFFVEWSLGSGLPTEDGSEVAGAGTMALWWLRRSAIPTDVARSLQAASYLDVFGFDGCIDDTTTPTEWLADHVVGTLPAYTVSSPSGVYLAPVRWSASASEIVAKLVEGEDGVVRTGRVEVNSDGRATEVRVRWARDIATGEYRETTTWTPDPTGAAFSRSLSALVPTPRTEAVRTVSVELPFCWSASTAQLVAEWLAWRDAIPRREVVLTVASGPRRAWLYEGAVVTYEDDSLGGREMVALVGSVERSDAPWWEVRLLLLRPTTL